MANLVSLQDRTLLITSLTSSNEPVFGAGISRVADAFSDDCDVSAAGIFFIGRTLQTTLV